MNFPITTYQEYCLEYKLPLPGATTSDAGPIPAQIEESDQADTIAMCSQAVANDQVLPAVLAAIKAAGLTTEGVPAELAVSLVDGIASGWTPQYNTPPEQDGPGNVKPWCIVGFALSAGPITVMTSTGPQQYPAGTPVLISELCGQVFARGIVSPRIEGEDMNYEQIGTGEFARMVTVRTNLVLQISPEPDGSLAADGFYAAPAAALKAEKPELKVFTTPRLRHPRRKA